MADAQTGAGRISQAPRTLRLQTDAAAGLRSSATPFSGRRAVPPRPAYQGFTRFSPFPDARRMERTFLTIGRRRAGRRRLASEGRVDDHSPLFKPPAG